MRSRVWWGLVFTVAVAAAVAVPLGPTAGADQLRGHTVCTPDGPAGFAWYEGEDLVATTESSTPEFDGVAAVGGPEDCVVTAACLESARVGWKEWTAIVGTDADDHLVGYRGRDVIVAMGGDDLVESRNGQDVVCGGGGDDELRGGAKGDVLIGGNGSDLIIGGAGRDTLRGNNGNDIVIGSGWHDTLRGGPDDDAIYGGGGIDDIRGGSGNDACFGGGDADVIAECPIHNQDGVRYGSGTMRDYTVQIQSGLGLDRLRVEAIIDRILGDQRSWVGGGHVGFRRVTSGWDFRIYIASPSTVDAICYPLNTAGYYSCRNGSTIALNVDRWKTATSWWPATLEVYRQYLVNHETGHMLGRGHVSCPGPGRLAPIMMQQTKGLAGCLPNGWVYP